MLFLDSRSQFGYSEGTIYYGSSESDENDVITQPPIRAR
jgi:hypothetical protein